jgi:hypothetical protein
MLLPILTSAKYVPPSNADLKVHPIFRWRITTLLLVPAGKTVGRVGRDQMADPTESPTAADPKAGRNDQPKDPS